MKLNFAVNFTVLLLMIVCTACSSRRKVETMIIPTPTPMAVEPVVEAAATPSPTPIINAEEILRKAEAKREKPSGVEPEKALSWLKNGNVRFAKGHLRKDGATRNDVKKVARAQRPHSVIVACSDSHAPPEVVFDQKLGEVYVVRTMGGSLDTSAIASVEYAVENLGVRHILVLGHTQCGAIKTALSTLGGKDAGSPFLNNMASSIQLNLQGLTGKEHSENYRTESWAQVNGVGRMLLSSSPLIAENYRSGQVKISSGVYDVHSGTVDFK